MVTRRGLMAGAGAGAALGAAGRAGAAAADTSGAGDPTTDQVAAEHVAAESSTAQVPRILAADRYPIGMWWPPPPFETNDARYQEIAEAGFTLVIGGNYVADALIGRWACAAAERAGLDYIPVDPDLTCLTHTFSAGGAPDQPFMLSDSEVSEGVRQALGRYPGRAFAGIDLFDEPSAPKFDTLTAYVAAVREQAPEALPYVNLFPTNDINYVRSFVETVRPPFVSFDRYPLLLDGDDPGWWNNLQIVRTVGLEAGIPYWVFIQSIEYAHHRMPSPAELSWQIGTCLAYGYKGIQYFTYWQPDPARGEAFEPALMTVDGRRTRLWHAAKAINPRLQQIGRRILPLTSQSISVTNVASPPKGLPAFAPDDWLEAADGDPVLIGQFADPAKPDQRVLVVSNHSHEARAETTLTFAPEVQPASQRVDLAKGGFTLVELERSQPGG